VDSQEPASGTGTRLKLLFQALSAKLRLEKARRDCTDSGLRKWIESVIEKQNLKGHPKSGQ